MTKLIISILFCLTISAAYGQEHFFDFIYRGADSNPSNFNKFNGIVYFTALNSSKNQCLYKTDGTALGTELLYEFTNGASTFTNFVAFNGKIFFRISTSKGAELWYTEGTSSTTKRFYQSPSFYSNRSIELAVFNNWLFYTEQFSEDSFYIRRVDTALNKNIIVSRNKHGYQYAKSNFVQTANYLFYAYSDQLYRVDNNFLVQKYWERSTSSAGDIPYLYESNNVVIFHIRNSSKTDVYAVNETGGNAQVTATLYGYTSFYDWVSTGNFFFYIAGEYNGWPKIYRLNTQNFNHTELGYAYTRDRKLDLEVYKGDVYYSAMVNGDCELYKVGPLSSTPIKVKDIAPDTSSNPQSFLVYDNKLFFSAFTKDKGRELWSSGGTASNTQLSFDFYKGKGSSNMGLKGIEINGKMLLSGYNPYYGTEIWISDGSESGTELLLNLNTAVDYGNQQVSTFMPVGDYLYLFANDSINGAELWRTDGTHEGTIFLDNINVDYLPSAMEGYTEFKGDLYGTAVSFIDGIELYKSDGTPKGSGFVTPSDLFSSSAPRDYVVQGNYMYFIARTGLFSGDAIFRSDGTKAGTKPYLATGNDIKSIDNLRKIDDKIYVSITYTNDKTFLHLMNTQKAKLFKYSTEATNEIKFFTKSDTSLVYLFERNKTWRLGRGNTNVSISGQKANILAEEKPDTFFTVGDREYMVAHTKSKTEIVLAFNELNYLNGLFPTESYSEVESIIGFKDAVIFSAKHATLGQELFVYQNTDTAAVLLADINKGSASSNPDNFYVFNDKLVFSATTADNGTEVWITDGTTAGTKLLWDIYEGSTSSNPTEFAAYKGYLYISASGPQREKSLYRFIVDSCDVIDPKLSASNSNNTICKGQSIELFAKTQVSVENITWLKNGFPLTETNDTLITDEIAKYQFVVNQGSCSLASNEIELISAPAFSFSVEFESDSAFCQGESINLIAKGNSDLKVKWYKNDEEYSEQLKTTTFTAGEFYAVGRNQYGCKDTSATLMAIVHENPKPEVLLKNDTLWCSAIESNAKYEWYFMGAKMETETKPFVVPTKNGAYKVAIIDSNGCQGESVGFKYEGNSIHGSSFTTIAVYPNPSNGKVTIQFNAATSDNLVLRIYSSTGQMVYQNQGMSSLKSIDIELPIKGINIIKVESEGISYQPVYVINQ